MKDLNKIHFEGKEPDETIEMLLRRHKVALGKKIFEFVLGAVLIAAAYYLLQRYTAVLADDTSLLYGIIALATGLLYLFLMLFIFHAWVDYYLDVWIVTNERIIATDQQGLFHRTTSELRLDRIQDVSSESRGVLATIFKYGTVQLRTASEEDRFRFRDVGSPDIVARRILELHERYVGADQQPASSRAAAPRA